MLIGDSNMLLSFKIECWFSYLCILQFKKGECVFLSCRNTFQKMHQQHEVQRTLVYPHNNCPLLTKPSARQGINAPIFSSLQYSQHSCRVSISAEMRKTPRSFRKGTASFVLFFRSVLLSTRGEKKLHPGYPASP